MNAIRVYGGKCLEGEILIQGSKNAALPILAASLLIEGVCEIENCPAISDVHHMLRLMETMGCRTKREGNRVWIDASGEINCDMPAELACVMRSSITLLGALIGRRSKVHMEYPGGCVIGKRPIDLHLDGLKRMSVSIKEQPCGFEATADRLCGAHHRLPFVSVGATENLILAAVLAEGQTIIEPAAKEPEIQTLCEFLIKAGAKISGIGTDRLLIEGVSKLHPVFYKVPTDRIVAGTYITACMCAGGRVFLKETPTQHMLETIRMARSMGVAITEYKDGLEICINHGMCMPDRIRTTCYPGFPTDMQSLFLSAMSVAEGQGVVEETIFENRYRVVRELCKMGANITVDGRLAYVKGVQRLQGTKVRAMELRGGAALVCVGLNAEGSTVICNKQYIDRGYENIVEDLKKLGARIEACNEDINGE